MGLILLDEGAKKVKVDVGGALEDSPPLVVDLANLLPIVQRRLEIGLYGIKSK